MSLFKTKDYSKSKPVKNVHGVRKPRKLKIQKQSEDKIIDNIINIFWLKKKKAIKDRIVRDMKIVFEQ